MNKVLLEMNEILGGQYEQPKVCPTSPREVAGTFMVSSGVTALDEEILENISNLTWEQVADIGLLATIGPMEFQSLSMAFTEGVPAFRETWNQVVEGSEVGGDLNRGAFVLLTKMTSKMESYSRYVYWCLNVLSEAADDIINGLIERKSSVKLVIPTGQTRSQHDKNADASQPYIGKDKVEPYEKSDKEQYMANKLGKIKNIEKKLGKMAAASGRDVDQAYPNLFIDLARERARNS